MSRVGSMTTHVPGYPGVARLTSNCHILRNAEYLGAGQLDGPDDFVYDNKSGVIYTSVKDGWIKKAYISKLKNSKIRFQNWVNTGGIPLGLARGLNNELIVADAHKGLLNVTRDGRVKLLTNMAENLKFNFTNGVDVANNGMIYFTDSSYKYSYEDAELALLDPGPYGRFMSYNPTTRKTKVLARDLYTPNGVVVSRPDQKSVIFCESITRRCTRYYLRVGKKVVMENFINSLPGLPSDIKYDNQGPNYWIGLILPNTSYYKAGALATTLDGKPIAQYTDFNVTCSSANRIGVYFYCASALKNYILRFKWNQNLHSRTCSSPFCSRKC
ncbi:hypothetical protein ACFE04_003263 [Oxalis oulophora]